MVRWLVFLSSLALVPGCFLDRSPIDVDERPDGQLPTADAGPRDAAVLEDATLPDPDAGCDPTAPPSCALDHRVECLGGRPVSTLCPFGCMAGACQVFIPSNVGGSIRMDAGDHPLTVAPGETLFFDTDTGEVINGGDTLRGSAVGEVLHAGIFYRKVDPADGAGLGVFVFGSLELPSNARVEVAGRRALVLLVGGDATIAGTIDVSSDGQAGGPGGGNGGDFESPGEGPGGGGGGTSNTWDGDDSGGGGGGFGSAGGIGGRGAGSPGVAHGQERLEPLIGGSGGGGGGDDDGGVGGGGGGAIQISCGGALVVSGTIDAGGGGGGGGRGATIDAGGGGGGGSGGAILLEARTVTVSGALAANGGAGGQGSRCNGGCSGSNSDDGGDGDAVTVPAICPPASDRGGTGGAGSDASGGPGMPGGHAQNGGGGGGGAGRIRLNARRTADVMVSRIPTPSRISIGAVTTAPPP